MSKPYLAFGSNRTYYEGLERLPAKGNYDENTIMYQMKDYLSPSPRRVSPVGIVLGILSFIAIHLPFASFADSITADVVDVTTPVYKPVPSEFQPRLGVYKYEVSWQGIPAAECFIEVEHDGDQYRLITTARTYSGIDLFYRLRYRSVGDISADDFLPIRSVTQQKENSKVKNTEIQFRPNGEIYSIRSQNDQAPKVLQFNPKNFTLEPFSASFVARSQPWKVGDSREFDTFNGKSRYLITLTAVEKTRINVAGTMKDVFVIEPKVKNLTDPATNSKLRSAKIYVTDDPAREIVRIASSVFVGTVTTKLVSFTPDSRSYATTLAKNSSDIGL